VDIITDKKWIILITSVVIVLAIAFFLSSNSFSGYFVAESSEEKIRLGYCPTMLEDAKKLAEENDYVLVKFSSASEVLTALNLKEIEKGLIGRKPENYELLYNLDEVVLKSGYTLVSNQKNFIEISELNNLEVHTYLPKEVVEEAIQNIHSIVFHESKEIALSKISEGKIVLVSWDDWQDDFGLTVVMDGNEKVKDFRCSCLYS